MNPYSAIRSLFFIGMVSMSLLVGCDNKEDTKDTTATSTTAASTCNPPHNLAERPMPTGDDLETLLPPQVGDFVRGEISGDPAQEAYATYTADDKSVFVSFAMGAGAKSGVETSADTVGETNERHSYNLNCDPAYFMVAGFIAWSQGDQYYYSVDANKDTELLAEFMASFR